MSSESILVELERRIADYLGIKYAIVCSSARNAIRFSLLTLEIGHADEVIIPDFACQIIPITVFCTGARPRFCDVDMKTCAMTSTFLKKVIGPRTRAAILIHPLGLPVDTEEIKKTAEKMNIFLIEDAAQSFGASINQKKTGTMGHIGVLSLYKFLNCNVGGVAVTNDNDMAVKIRNLRNKLEKKSQFISFVFCLMDFFGVNTRKNRSRLLWLEGKIMKNWIQFLTKKSVGRTEYWIRIEQSILQLWKDNILSSNIIDLIMGQAGIYWPSRKMETSEFTQINKEFDNLEKYLDIRRRIAKNYDEVLVDKGFEKIRISDVSKPSYLRYPIILHDKKKRNKLRKIFDQFGFNAKYYCYRPLHTSPIFGPLNRETNYPGSSYISKHLLPLPTDPSTNPKIINKIISTLNANQNKI